MGDVRIGLAISDPMGIVATPYDTIVCTSEEADAEAIAKVVAAEDVKRVVAGLPLNQHGEVGSQAQKVLDFLDVLKKHTTVDIVTQDERFTTAAVERMLIGAGVSRKKRKSVVDQLAAQQILQTYIERQRR